MYSPILYGLVKMMVRPATRLRHPCVASPSPTPTTPTPAMIGAIWTPNLSNASTTARAKTSSLTVRTISMRIGGSRLCFSSQRLEILPAQVATSAPMMRMMTAPTIRKP
jgi:hypothetical protein